MPLFARGDKSATFVRCRVRLTSGQDASGEISSTGESVSQSICNGIPARGERSVTCVLTRFSSEIPEPLDRGKIGNVCRAEIEFAQRSLPY